VTEPNFTGAEPDRLWVGSGEAIFTVLPQSVLRNFYSPRSENALLWNLIYPRAQPSFSLKDLLTLDALWGTPDLGSVPDEHLIPYYWGFQLDGSRLSELDETLASIDGGGPQTEVDLFLLGEKTLIGVESKRSSGFGRCARYSAGRCPEIHPNDPENQACRYWEPGPGCFSDSLGMGPRPTPDSELVPCNLHYQLARTYVVGSALAQRLGRQFALWIFLPQRRWRALEPTWLDFVERVGDDQSWRWMRVISWEQLQTLPAS
jgi:hypothetical protein